MPSREPNCTNCHVSVVIPCYNHAQYLGAAIQSVLAQTYRDFQIIVVDDGSTDDTAQVAGGFGTAVRYVFQPNAGLSAARNTGIRVSCGEYLAFLDADDLWLPNFLATLVPRLDRDTRLGAVYSGSRFVDEEGHFQPQRITRTVPADRLHATLTSGDFFPAHAVLVRKSVLNSVGFFDESLCASEDWDMWLRVSAKYPFAGISSVLALYRMHGDSMSGDLGRMLESQLKVVKKHFGAGHGDPASWPVDRQRSYAGTYFWHALAQYQRHEPDLGLSYLSQALTVYPPVSCRLSSFYALACAEQNPGYMGDLRSWDLGQNANRMLGGLRQIFDSDVPLRLRVQRQTAFGTAYFALGILAYGKRELRSAREYLMMAVKNRPALLINGQWLATLAKSCLGRRLLGTLVSWKQVQLRHH